MRTDVDRPGRRSTRSLPRRSRPLGGVDVVCLNAGVFAGGFSWETTLDDWDWVLGVNLRGVINGIRSFVPRLIEAGVPSHVITTASIAGVVAAPASAVYCTSKFAALGLTEALHHDLGLAGAAHIGVSAICPGHGVDQHRPRRPEPTAGLCRGHRDRCVPDGRRPASTTPWTAAGPHVGARHALEQVEGGSLLRDHAPGGPLGASRGQRERGPPRRPAAPVPDVRVSSPVFDNRVTRALGVDDPDRAGPDGLDRPLAARLGRLQRRRARDHRDLVGGARRRSAMRSGEMSASTDKPFGVNIAQAFVRDPGIVDFVAGEGVRFVTTSAGSPTQYTKALKERGLTVFHVVPTLQGRAEGRRRRRRRPDRRGRRGRRLQEPEPASRPSCCCRSCARRSTCRSSPPGTQISPSIQGRVFCMDLRRPALPQL